MTRNPNRVAGPAAVKLLDSHGTSAVMIYSGDRRLYWRPRAHGYTEDPEEAGVYSLAKAYELTKRFHPEFRIAYQFLEPITAEA